MALSHIPSLPGYKGGTKTAEVLSHVQQLFETRHAGTRKG